MIRKVIALFLFVLVLTGCRHQNVSKPQETATDTTAMMVYQIQHCAKLYTQAYKLRKIVVYDDTAALTGHVLGQDFKVNLPLGKRRIAIPMTATAQASIDFSHFSATQVRRNGKKSQGEGVVAAHTLLRRRALAHRAARAYRHCQVAETDESHRERSPKCRAAAHANAAADGMERRRRGDHLPG